MANKVYTYEEAMEESTKYFDGDTLAAGVFVSKYGLRNNDNELVEKTPAHMHRRIARELARADFNKYQHTTVTPLTEDEIFGYLDHFKYIVPQGSPMEGIGNTYKFISLSNCFVVEPPGDSYSQILKTDAQLVHISKRRGGNGVDLDELRPEGAPTRNAARTSTGVPSFMKRYSHSIREVGQAGRRGALMMTLSCKHPDMLKFASIKRDKKEVTGANISLRIFDSFMKAVQKDGEYTLQWPVNSDKPKIKEVISAKKAWMEIADNAHYSADPGILFWDTIIKNSPADCYAALGFQTRSTNPCGEIPLASFDSCRLLVINLLGCVDNPYTSKASFNFEKYKSVVRIAQRLMDNIVDLEVEAVDRIIAKIDSDPESAKVKEDEREIWTRVRDMAINGRRTGTGITALGDTIAAIGMRYGSDESIDFVSAVYMSLKLESYRESVEMAKVLGPFPIWNAELEKDNIFLLRIKKDDSDLYMDMQKYGRRNIALNTTPPAGSVSIETRTTSGIEPAFNLKYGRRRKVNKEDEGVRIDFIDENGDTWQNYDVFHPELSKWLEINKNEDGSFKPVEESPWYKATAHDVHWKSRIAIQAAAQIHVDHSISSTLNVAKDTTVKKIAEIYEAAWEAGLKGVTVYRDGCKSGVLVNDDSGRINKNTAPDRPKYLQADVHHLIYHKQRYYCIVGLMGGDPYEVFVGINATEEGEINIPKDLKSGVVGKIERGFYQLEIPGSDDKYRINDSHSDPTANALTRMISTSLRHGASIEFVVHQLEKTKGPMDSFAKVLARTLKKYIEDGTAAGNEKCPRCKEQMVHQGGCPTCMTCGYSKCN